MDTKVIQDFLLDLLYVIIIAVVPVISKFIVDYLQAQREKLNLETDNEYFADIEIKAISIIQTVVDTVSQTYVDLLKESGKFGESEQKEAFNRALITAKKLMDDEMLDFIKTSYSDIDKWVTIQIESYIKSGKVKDSKANKAIPIVDVTDIKEIEG